jgi:hypothetical protein
LALLTAAVGFTNRFLRIDTEDADEDEEAEFEKVPIPVEAHLEQYDLAGSERVSSSSTCKSPLSDASIWRRMPSARRSSWRCSPQQIPVEAHLEQYDLAGSERVHRLRKKRNSQFRLPLADWHFFELGFFVLIGIFGGLYGAFVIKFNLQVAAFRRSCRFGTGSSPTEKKK